MINHLPANRPLAPTEKSQPVNSQEQIKKWDKPADLVIILGSDMDSEGWVDEIIADAEKKGLSVGLIGNGENEITQSDIEQSLKSGAFGPNTHTLIAMEGGMQNNMHILANGIEGNYAATIDFLQALRGNLSQTASSPNNTQSASYNGTIHVFSSELGKTHKQIANNPLLAKNGNYMLHGSAEFVSFHTIARNTTAIIDYLSECKHDCTPPDYATMACRVNEITGDALTLVGSSLEAPLLMRAPWKPEHVIPSYLLTTNIKNKIGDKNFIQGNAKDIDKLLQAKKVDRPSTRDHLYHKAFNTLIRKIELEKFDDAANLIEAMPELVDKFPAQFQPIFYAIDGKHIGLLHALIRAGASVNTSDTENKTPLEKAVLQGSTDLVKCLIDNQADVNNYYYEKQFNLLQLAVTKKIPDLVQYLISLESIREYDGLGYQNNDGMSALHIAAQVGEAEIVRILLDAGAPQELEDDDGCSALWHAVDAGNADVIQLLANNRKLINLDDDEGRTPLHLAIEKGDIPAMNILIKAGANALLQDNDGNTPLHLAINTLDSNTISRFCRFPGLINIRNNENKTALTIARESGKSTIVNLLKLAGATE